MGGFRSREKFNVVSSLFRKGWERILSFFPKKKPHSEKYYKRIAFLNKYSLIFHFILACFFIFVIEVISRRDLISAVTFLSNHTLAFLYNALIIFASLTSVDLTKYRAQLRILISGIWIFLGTVNGLILSNRVTPLSYTDIKSSLDLFQMQNTTVFLRQRLRLLLSLLFLSLYS